MWHLHGQASTVFTPQSNRSSRRHFRWIYRPGFDEKPAEIGGDMEVCVVSIGCTRVRNLELSFNLNHARVVLIPWGSATSFKTLLLWISQPSFDQKRPRTELAIKVMPVHLRLAGESCGIFTELALWSFYIVRIVPRFGKRIGRMLFHLSQLLVCPKRPQVRWDLITISRKSGRL